MDDVRVRKIRGRYRIVERDGRLSRASRGGIRDGGGHSDRAKALRQAGYINDGRRDAAAGGR